MKQTQKQKTESQKENSNKLKTWVLWKRVKEEEAITPVQWFGTDYREEKREIK